MAKYIEFVGVPGVGKTTTYKYMRAWRKGKSNYVLYEDLCRQNLRENKLKESLKFYFKKLSEPDLLPKVPHNRTVLNRAIENNPELIDLFWKRISENENPEGKEFRFYGVKYIRDVLEKVQNVKDRASESYCLVDEGIIHNLQYFIPCSAYNTFSPVQDVLRKIDLPQAVVYFEGDVEVVLKRTLLRGNLRLRDRHLNIEEIKKSRMASKKQKDFFMEAVKANNIPVLNLKAKESVRTKAEQILDFVKAL